MSRPQSPSSPVCRHCRSYRDRPLAVRRPARLERRAAGPRRPGRCPCLAAPASAEPCCSPLTGQCVRKQRRRHLVGAATRHRQALLAPRTAIDERPQQRKIVREILEHPLEIPFEANDSRPRLGLAPIAPLAKLPRHHFLNRLAIRQVRRTARARANEVALAERQACCEIGRFDQPGDLAPRRRCHAEPVPPALDHLAERADGDALAVTAQPMVPFDEPDDRRRAATAQPNRNRHAFGTGRRGAQLNPVHLERDARPIMPAQNLGEGRIEQRLEVLPDCLVHVAGVEERRQLVEQHEPHRRAARGRESGRS
jgi:hypothetical protein